MMKQARNSNYLLLFLIIIIATEAIFFSVGNFRLNQKTESEEQEVKKLQRVLVDIPILAKAVSIYDITTSNKIYGKDDTIPMPIASLSKIMTVLVALAGRDQNELVYISKEAVNQAGDFGIFANEKWRVGDIAKFTLIASANDGAYALSERSSLFLEEMNSKAKRIGMQNTSFLNFTGLDIDESKPSAFATAEDMNALTSFALLAEPEIFRITSNAEINLKSESGFLHNFKNTNTIIGKIPNLLFSKTGFTNIAGGNLSIIFENKNGHQIAVTILGSTMEGRFTDMENIVNALSRFP